MKTANVINQINQRIWPERLLYWFPSRLHPLSLHLIQTLRDDPVVVSLLNGTDWNYGPALDKLDLC